MSVAQVSRQVAQLEDRLQAKLLLYHPSGASHRTRGDLFAAAASCWTTCTRRSWRWGAIRRCRKVPCLITAPVSYGEPHRALVNDFMVRFPQLEVTLNLTNQLLDLVHEGYDLAIRLGHLKDSTWWPASWRSGCPYVRLAGLHRPSRHAQQPLGLARHTCLVGSGDEWHFPRTVNPTACGCAALQCNSGPPLLDAAIKDPASSSCRTTT